MAREPTEIPDDLRYSTEHEWLRVENGDSARVGITAYAQDRLGDIVFVDLPRSGAKLEFMQKLGEIESVKVASEIFSPVTGEVVETNAALDGAPELVNNDPYGAGWLAVVRVGNKDDVDRLLSPEAYRELIKREMGEH